MLDHSKGCQTVNYLQQGNGLGIHQKKHWESQRLKRMTKFSGSLTLVGSHDSFLSTVSRSTQGFPDGSAFKRIHLQCRRHRRCRFDSWVWKIPWRRKWQDTPVFLPRKKISWTEEPGGLHSKGPQRVRQD